jgi:cytochrome c oxidase subunit II
MLHPMVAYASSTFMPPQATDLAPKVDMLYSFLLWASLISFIILIGGMIVFALRYQRKSFDQKTAYITHNTLAEFLWSFIPFVIFMVSAIWGIVLFMDLHTPKDGALEVQVFGKKWEWEFVYKNGRRVTNDLGPENTLVPATMVLPVNTPIRLVMTSTETVEGSTPVLHSFFVPSFRIKQDLVPGMYTTLNFTPTRTGEFWVMCTEYCGTGHSRMLGKVRVVEREEFEAWLADDEGGPGAGEMDLAAQGRRFYTQYGCSGCHSVDGTRTVGPTFKGLFGALRTFADGTSTTADENYVRDSILNPNAQVVQGYPANVMPSYKGQVSEEQITAIIEFIKTL